MVEHLASRSLRLSNVGALHGHEHAGRHAAYGFSVMDVYDHSRTDTHTLHHPGTRAPCGLVKRIKGDKAMIWSSPAEFFAMGGYGTYVWGSLSVTIAKNRSEEHTSELQSLMRISYAVFCLKKNKTQL